MFDMCRRCNNDLINTTWTFRHQNWCPRRVQLLHRYSTKNVYLVGIRMNCANRLSSFPRPLTPTPFVKHPQWNSENVLFTLHPSAIAPRAMWCSDSHEVEPVYIRLGNIVGIGHHCWLRPARFDSPQPQSTEAGYIMGFYPYDALSSLDFVLPYFFHQQNES